MRMETETVEALEVAINIATDWWLRQLKYPSKEAGGTLANTAGKLVQETLNKKGVDPIKTERFKMKMGEELRARASNNGNGWGICLETDYEPWHLLRDLAVDAGIDFQCFPWKTEMRVNHTAEETVVTVKCGYGQPKVQLYRSTKAG